MDEPQNLATPDRIWRRSAVEAFGCPARYEAIHIHGVDDTGDESMRGRAVHAAAWVYVLRLAAKAVTSDHEEARMAFAQGVAITGCPDHLIHQVDRLFFRWAERFELDLDAFLGAEELQQHGGRVFRPDIVYARPNELEIVDLKTYYKGLTEGQARQELQLRWYLVEALKAWPGFAFYRFTYDFIRLGYQVSLRFTPDEILAFEPGVQAAIGAVAEAEQRGEFPALPGSHCTLCRLECPAVDHKRRLPVRIKSKDQAEWAFGQILAGEQRLKALKKALGGYCLTEGPIELRGEVFAHRGTTSRRFKLSDVLDHLPNGATQQITLSTTDLKPVWPRTVTVPQALLDAGQESTHWAFKHRKAGEQQPADTVDLLRKEGDDDDSED